MPELLLEFFSEEIPARMQAQAAADLKTRMLKGLKEAGVDHGAAASYATPRRLTLVIEDMIAETQAVREEVKGPRVGAPEKALEGFLRKTGLTKDQLETRDDKKGQVYFALRETPGRKTLDIIAELAPEVAKNFPWPKSMRWGAGDLRWVRPLRSVLCILSEGDAATVAPFELGDLKSADVTYGHRFLSVDRSGAPKALTVSNFADYKAQLKKAKVILAAEDRMAKISRDLKKLAKAEGLEALEDQKLLAEVAGLVEHPVVLLGEIEKQFQDLPPEVLQTSMREHQKYFSLRAPKSGKIVRFATVSNMEARDKGAKIIAGNQRVLRARLADAQFFYNNDLSRPLESLAPKLKAVTFHNQLGSVADRIARIEAFAAQIAPMIGATADLAARAAKLAKADLASEMVYEFPELQGVMGGYYAAAAKEPKEVCAAAAGHYAPQGPSDEAPTAPVTAAVALADKLDQLAAFWTIDEKPTGSGDPFALRRAALGVIRILLENNFRIALEQTLKAHADRLNPDISASARRGDEIVAEAQAKNIEQLIAEGGDGVEIHQRTFGDEERHDLMRFIRDRLKVHLRGEGVRHDVIDAVYALTADDDLARVKKRIDALAGLVGSDDGENLLAAFKRANNILTAEEKKDGVEYSMPPELKFAEEPAEKALFKALDKAEGKIGPALAKEDYPAAMQAMAKLRAPLDTFFDEVMVNAENQIVRRNRLCLMRRITQVMGQTADWRLVEG